MTNSYNSADIVVSIVAGSLLFFLLCTFIVAFTALFIRKRRQHNIETQKLQAQFVETLLQAQLEIREHTLQQIARDLHDNLGQVASVIKIYLNTLALDDTTKAREKIEDTKELVRQLITDIKSLSVSLSADRITAMGLTKMVEAEIDRLNKTGQFSVVLSMDGTLPAFSPTITVILFRMIQEILNNIIKHSQAKNISIRFQTSTDLFKLECTDDGIGFNLDEKMRSSGSGLINLHNRAKLMSGNLFIKSAPNEGTTISIQLPV